MLCWPSPFVRIPAMVRVTYEYGSGPAGGGTLMGCPGSGVITYQDFVPIHIGQLLCADSSSCHFSIMGAAIISRGRPSGFLGLWCSASNVSGWGRMLAPRPGGHPYSTPLNPVSQLGPSSLQCWGSTYTGSWLCGISPDPQLRGR